MSPGSRPGSGGLAAAPGSLGPWHGCRGCARRAAQPTGAPRPQLAPFLTCRATAPACHTQELPYAWPPKPCKATMAGQDWQGCSTSTHTTLQYCAESCLRKGAPTCGLLTLMSLRPLCTRYLLRSRSSSGMAKTVPGPLSPCRCLCTTHAPAARKTMLLSGSTSDVSLNPARDTPHLKICRSATRRTSLAFWCVLSSRLYSAPILASEAHARQGGHTRAWGGVVSCAEPFWQCLQESLQLFLGKTCWKDVLKKVQVCMCGTSDLLADLLLRP